MKKNLTERQKTIMYILGFVIAAIAALLVYVGAIAWTMINGGIFVVFMYFIMIPVATLIFWMVAGLYSKITKLFFK